MTLTLVSTGYCTPLLQVSTWIKSQGRPVNLIMSSVAGRAYLSLWHYTAIAWKEREREREREALLNFPLEGESFRVYLLRKQYFLAAELNPGRSSPVCILVSLNVCALFAQQPPERHVKLECPFGDCCSCFKQSCEFWRVLAREIHTLFWTQNLVAL